MHYPPPRDINTYCLRGSDILARSNSFNSHCESRNDASVGIRECELRQGSERRDTRVRAASRMMPSSSKPFTQVRMKAISVPFRFHSLQPLLGQSRYCGIRKLRTQSSQCYTRLFPLFKFVIGITYFQTRIGYFAAGRILIDGLLKRG